jgi:thiamine-phosphate pyrophosphorylase
VTICLVTDRRRLGKALGAPAEQWTAQLLTQVRAAVEAGVDLIQLRETDLDGAALFALASSIVNEIPGARGRLMVNDRLDVAMAAGAGGVHLRESSFSAHSARQIAPQGFRIGRSVHDVEGAAHARAADYLIAGTVLSTSSKTQPSLLGWDGLRSIVCAAEGLPILGIGGLTAASVPALSATGAAGLAAIGAFVPDADQDLATFVQQTVKKLRFVFDSTGSVS